MLLLLGAAAAAAAAAALPLRVGMALSARRGCGNCVGGGGLGCGCLCGLATCCSCGWDCDCCCCCCDGGGVCGRACGGGGGGDGACGGAVRGDCDCECGYDNCGWVWGFDSSCGRAWGCDGHCCAGGYCCGGTGPSTNRRVPLCHCRASAAALVRARAPTLARVTAWPVGGSRSTGGFCWAAPTRRGRSSHRHRSRTRRPSRSLSASLLRSRACCCGLLRASLIIRSFSPLRFLERICVVAQCFPRCLLLVGLLWPTAAGPPPPNTLFSCPTTTSKLCVVWSNKGVLWIGHLKTFTSWLSTTGS